MTILLIDGSQHNLGYFTKKLEPMYRVDCVQLGNDAIVRAESKRYDLILIGAYIPDTNYVDLVERMRILGIDSPILVTPSPGTRSKAFAAMEAGADDFVEKPVCCEELLVRIQALLRRTDHREYRRNQLIVGCLVLDIERMLVTLNGQFLSFSPREFELLEYLMRHAGQVVCRNRIVETVWDSEVHSDSIIEVYIKSLRDKIDRPYGTELIKTIRGFGYMISE